jgi:uncharacterized protein (TIGR02421 family)
MLSADERRYEEDPFTEEIISSFPITIQGLDSRYRYDLNRSPQECIYNIAWDKKIWRTKLSRKEREESQSRHASYYKILECLITMLEDTFKACVIYDIHSFNYKRREDTPLFNIGTHFIDRNTFGPVLAHLQKQLRAVSLPNIENRFAFDEVFQGRGHQASFVHRLHPASLHIPLEIKKVYMDELTGEAYPLILENLKEALKHSLSYNGAYFARKYAGKRVHRSHFIAVENGKLIKSVDDALYKIARNLDTLQYINPVNLVQERKRFYSKKYNYTPQFVYRQLKIDPFVFRKSLYEIPVDDIRDVSIRQLYRNTVDMLAARIDLLATIGTDSFLYNSLRYYGEPRESDIQLARFFISAPPIEKEETADIDATDCALAFREAVAGYGFKCRVELSNKIVARAMVSNTRKAILINKQAKFSKTDINALISHELGVHMITTVNSDHQPLKIFKLGLPGNTETQEGLAIFCEYLSGNLTLPRIKTLAFRVIAVQMMVQGFDFSRIYKTLSEDFGLSRETAFRITARVFRGGGFTKDYLYLSGLQKVLRLHRSGDNIELLFVGKTSVAHLGILKEMAATNVIKEPHLLPNDWNSSVGGNLILDYLLGAAATL